MLALFVTATLLIGAASPSPDLLQAALDPNPGLKSYVASAQLQVQARGIVRVRKTFTGTASYNRPVQKIEFDNVTGPFRAFRDLTTTLPSKADIERDYRVTAGANDGSVAVFTADAASAGARVRSITFSIDERSKLLTSAQWLYSDGSTLLIEPHYQPVHGYELPAREDIRARFKGLSADGTLTLTDFKIGRTF